MTEPVTRRFASAAAGGLLAVGALSLTACGDTAGPEAGTRVEDIQQDAADTDEGAYDGPYDTDFYDDELNLEGETVTVSAEVDEVLSPSSFVIAGTDGSSVEPLLIVSATGDTDVEPNLPVAVTGTVHTAFDLSAVEEELGVDLDDALYEAYDQQPYITATTVDTSVLSDQ